MLPWDADEKVVQEVGAASEAQHSVGQLESEVSGLAQLTGYRQRQREREHFLFILFFSVAGYTACSDNKSHWSFPFAAIAAVQTTLVHTYTAQ